MMGIFKLFSSEATTLNDQTPQMLYSKQYSTESTSTSITSISDSVGSSNSNEKGDVIIQNINDDYASKKIMYASGDGPPENDSVNLSTTNQNNDEWTEKIEDQNEENKLLNEVPNERVISQQTCEIIKGFEDILANLLKDRDQIIDHKDIALAHLSNMEYAFYDVTTKYERAKQIVAQYSENEEILKKALQNNELLLNHREQKYEILKKHATDKLMEANVELDKVRKAHTVEIAKLNAVIKKSECKVKYLEQQLEQKIAENNQMARLWEELNNNIHNENYSTELTNNISNCSTELID